VIVRLGIASGWVLGDESAGPAVPHEALIVRLDATVARRPLVIERKLAINDVREDVALDGGAAANFVCLKIGFRLEKVLALIEARHLVEWWIEDEVRVLKNVHERRAIVRRQKQGR